MKILEQIYILDQKYPRYVSHLNRLKEFGVLQDILSTASRNLARKFRAKQKIKYSNKRLELRKASLNPTQRKLLNF